MSLKLVANHSSKVIEEWHTDQNGSLSLNDLGFNSKRKVWWICSEGHVWQAKVESRNRGTGCPICKVYKATMENCLATVKPEISKEWDPEKNQGITPYDVAVYSKKRIWWICKNGHEWQVSVYIRSRGASCPKCYRCERKQKYVIHEHPELIKQWHPIKNDVQLKTLTTGSSVKVWWICEKGHEWKAQIKHRCKGTGCPFCTGKKVSTDNCLAKMNPELANQWHPTKNKGLTALEVTIGTNKKVWWMCENGHEWEARINYRNYAGRGCPYCKKMQVHGSL